MKPFIITNGMHCRFFKSEPISAWLAISLQNSFSLWVYKSLQMILEICNLDMSAKNGR